MNAAPLDDVCLCITCMLDASECDDVAGWRTIRVILENVSERGGGLA